MVVNIITYTCDLASNRIFALVDDGSVNLQVYVGDASGFNQDSTDPTILKWSKYIRQPLGLAPFINAGFLVDIRYAHNTIYIKNISTGRVIVLPEDMAQQASIINTNFYPNDPHRFYESNNFVVFKDGSFYYGANGGVFYVNALGYVKLFASLVIDLNAFPTIIEANTSIVVAVSNDEFRGIYVSRVADKDNLEQGRLWYKAGFGILPNSNEFAKFRIRGIFIDEVNAIINVATTPIDPSSSKDGVKLTLQRFDYARFLINPANNPLELLGSVDLQDYIVTGGLTGEWIDAIRHINGVRVGFIDTTDALPVSKSILLSSKGSNGKYDITYEASNPIDINPDLQNNIHAEPTIAIPSNDYAFYLAVTGDFYVAPGGITKAFNKIQIEKIT